MKESRLFEAFLSYLDILPLQVGWQGVCDGVHLTKGISNSGIHIPLRCQLLLPESLFQGNLKLVE